MLQAASSQFISRKAWTQGPAEVSERTATTRSHGHVTLRLAEQHLVFGLQHQQVGHVPERQAEADHLRLRDVVGELAYVDDLGRRVAFELLAVAAIGCGGGGEEQNFDVLSSVTASERAWSELHMHVSRTGALPSQRGGGGRTLMT